MLHRLRVQKPGARGRGALAAGGPGYKFYSWRKYFEPGKLGAGPVRAA